MRRNIPQPSGNQQVGKRIYWKRRPSEIRGYHRTLYLNSENGDYLRVDYNLKDKRIRLYIEDSDEGGNPYYSVISNGRVTAERNATTGRGYNLSEKFRRRADIFSTIPNREVIRLINKKYGIGESSDDSQKRESQRRKELEQTRKRYFRTDDTPSFASRGTTAPRPQVGFTDFKDVVISSVLTGGMYFFTFDLIKTGIVAAFCGIIMGMLDIFIRYRQTIFVKLFIFLIAGLILYVYGYYIL